MTDTQTTVEIPADVKDNNTHTVRVQWRGVRDAQGEVESGKKHLRTFGYTLYEWDDADKDGTRVTLSRFVNKAGETVDLFATYYFTRVVCEDCRDFLAQSYATHYQAIATSKGASSAVPRCSEHGYRFRRSIAGEPGVTVIQSEPLRIGQHD